MRIILLQQFHWFWIILICACVQFWTNSGIFLIGYDQKYLSRRYNTQINAIAPVIYDHVECFLPL